MDNNNKWVGEYLKKRHPKAVLKEVALLGGGWHGEGFRVVYEDEEGEKTVIARRIRDREFSHDYVSDRVATFIIQHKIAGGIKEHVKSHDVVAVKDDGIALIGDVEEAFQIVELAEGSPYINDFERIRKEGAGEEDYQIARELAGVLAGIHSRKFKGEEERAASLYKRHLRDAIGHGEMLLGVIDTYPKESFLSVAMIKELVALSAEHREKIKHNYKRLSRMHGDFHQFNILIKNKEMKLLDASREIWGEPADDLTCMAINYIWYWLMSKREDFLKLFTTFWGGYLEKTGDDEIGRFAPLFFAFRSVVVSHPVYYPDQTDELRRKMINFAIKTLREGDFDYKRVREYF